MDTEGAGGVRPGGEAAGGPDGRKTNAEEGSRPLAGHGAGAEGCELLSARHDRDLGDVWEVLLSLRDTVENDYGHRLRRIETDLRWVMTLLGGLTVALIGAAISGVLRG
ncbi:MAG: hypothetical protein FJ313_00785 [Gemmatimonadetes bacterium]|nr:hypothetical protein [Gemmatimonadota bacterium]